MTEPRLSSILRELADAGEHLLKVHSCDSLGWEGVTYARDYARAYAAQEDITLDSGADTPWPVSEVLARLSDAAWHLCTGHRCRHPGIRSVMQARAEALVLLGLPVEPPCPFCGSHVVAEGIGGASRDCGECGTERNGDANV